MRTRVNKGHPKPRRHPALHNSHLVLDAGPHEAGVPLSPEEIPGQVRDDSCHHPEILDPSLVRTRWSGMTSKGAEMTSRGSGSRDPLVIFRAIRYFAWLMLEIIKSGIAVSKIAWARNLNISPVIEQVSSIQNTELGRVIYANSITLTPGTITINLEDNKLLVHAIDIAFIQDLKSGDMDKKVARI